MGIISKIGPLAILGLGILFLGNALTSPAQATQTAQALTASGVGLGQSTASPNTKNFVETLSPSYVLNTNATYSFIEDNYNPTDQIAIKRAIEESRAKYPQYFDGGASSRA